MDTYCKTCAFRTGIPHNPDIPECDCVLGKLEQFAEQDVKIEYDEWYPVLKNITCPYYRNKEWVDDNIELVGDSLEDVENFIIKENGFPYSVFIYDNDDIDLLKAVKQLFALDHKPTYLHITFRFRDQNVDLLTALSKLIEAQKTVRYRLSINLDLELDHFYESYLAFKIQAKTQFVGIMYKNVDILPEATTELTEKIQRELYTFPFANTDNNEFLLFPISILEEYIGFEGPNFITKILETQCQNYNIKS